MHIHIGRVTRASRLAGVSVLQWMTSALGAAATRWLAARGIAARVQSLVLDEDRAVVFVRAAREVGDSFMLGEALKAHLRDEHGKTADTVYWKFHAGPGH